jgi:hypothetical protein
MRHRGLLVALGLVIVAVGCDPAAGPTDPAVVEVELEIGATGGATAHVYVAPERADRVEEIAEPLGESLFGPDAVVTVDGNDGGFDFAHIRTQRLYAPGTHPSFTTELSNDALSAVATMGIERVNLTMCAPYVRWHLAGDGRHGHDCVSWTVDTAGPALVVAGVLDPSTGRQLGAGVLWIAEAAGAFAAAGLVLTKRAWAPGGWWLLLAAGLAGVVAAIIRIATRIDLANELGVNGRLGPAGVRSLEAVQVAALVLPIACFVAAVRGFAGVAEERRTARQRKRLEKAGRHGT